VARSIDALQKSGSRILGYVENMEGYTCPDCQRVQPLFPGRTRRKLDPPRLGGIPFDPGLAALCDRGGSLSESAALPSWPSVRRVAEEICRRVADRAPAPEESA
jgi:hypothetical protein